MRNRTGLLIARLVCFAILSSFPSRVFSCGLCGSACQGTSHTLHFSSTALCAGGFGGFHEPSYTTLGMGHCASSCSACAAPWSGSYHVAGSIDTHEGSSWVGASGCHSGCHDSYGCDEGACGGDSRGELMHGDCAGSCKPECGGSGCSGDLAVESAGCSGCGVVSGEIVAPEGIVGDSYEGGYTTGEVISDGSYMSGGIPIESAPASPIVAPPPSTELPSTNQAPTPSTPTQVPAMAPSEDNSGQPDGIQPEVQPSDEEPNSGLFGEENNGGTLDEDMDDFAPPTDLPADEAFPAPDEPAAPDEAPADGSAELDDLFGTSGPILIAFDKDEQVTRLWTDNSGSFHTNGRLVLIARESVRILKENGHHCTVPFLRLSRIDLQYVVQIARSEKDGTIMRLAAGRP